MNIKLMNLMEEECSIFISSYSLLHFISIYLTSIDIFVCQFLCLFSRIESLEKYSKYINILYAFYMPITYKKMIEYTNHIYESRMKEDLQ